jgi:acyl-CoA thioester hydrolase
MLERRIEIRWRDLDAYGHVNNAVYLNYLEEARDAWVQAVLGKVGDTWDFVLARVAIDFKHELTQEDGAVLVRCALDSFGRSSVRTREEIVKLDGTISALAESVVVARDPDARRSRPLNDEERAALERELNGGTA